MKSPAFFTPCQKGNISCDISQGRGRDSRLGNVKCDWQFCPTADGLSPAAEFVTHAYYGAARETTAISVPSFETLLTLISSSVTENT